MNAYLAIAALSFAGVGFLSYLFIIMASALGCCLGVTTTAFYHVVLVVLVLAVAIFSFCMFRGCCKINEAKK